ncbi:MAG: 50S ribosomal protein L25/general stress protein Ctc [Methylococcales bacterium]|nr:50S ribosomal protein L25/general stress protein Ctc [Methylococcales bacterium]MDD5754988.1 50S ribosomal protein L25/general stress protein Ctc [Methylococcales bacterium]
MSNVFEFVAETRKDFGKTSARAMRRAGNIPAVIYGHGEPQMLSLNHNEVVKHLAHEEVYSHILDVTVDGKTEKAILKDVQRHPAKVRVLHLDFLRINLADRIKVHVPLHFVNEHTSIGGKKGGVAAHTMASVEVFCLPAFLPEFIEVNLIMLDVGHSIHLSELSLPANVQIVALTHGIEHDLAVVSMQASKVAAE